MFWELVNPDLWLSVAALSAILRYWHDYESASKSSAAILFVGGIAIGRFFWLSGQIRDRLGYWGQAAANWLTVILLASLLGSISLIHTIGIAEFQYGGWTRWCGPWENPNLAGLLMGVGIVLAMGLAPMLLHGSDYRAGSEAGRRERMESPSLVIRRVLFALCLVAVGFMGWALLRTLSRGAWMATCCGLFFLGGMLLKLYESMFFQFFRRNVLPMAVAGLSLSALLIWNSNGTGWRPIRRAATVANQNDFSWRNRVTAWEGALNIFAHYPWFGGGWNQPEQLYALNYYLPRNLSLEKAASH